MAVIPLPRATEPPMSEAEYQASLYALDAERAALKQDYITSQTYPRWGYHATEPPQLVSSDAEALALGDGWSATPIVAPLAPPVVTALAPDTVALGAPSFVIHVHGTGFALDAVIVWNGSAEATTVVSDTELTTGVNMATASAAVTIPVLVRNGDGTESNARDFTFTEAA